MQITSASVYCPLDFKKKADQTLENILLQAEHIDLFHKHQTILILQGAQETLIA